MVLRRRFIPLIRSGWSATFLLALATALPAAELAARRPAADVEANVAAGAVADQCPSFHLVRVAPYRVFTDEPTTEVETALRILRELRAQFERHFAALLQTDLPTREIQVVLFGQETDFRRYARRVAPAFEYSAGFYSGRENQLALVDQPRPTTFAQRGQPMADRDAATPAITRASLPVWPEQGPGAVSAMTERVIRHEGAHQLFAHYRIHSRYALEPTWLTEGLAEYCAPAEIGRWHEAQVRTLKELRRTGRLWPLETLLNHRDPAGFFAFGLESAEAAYAQSWALVWLLMQESHREKFVGLLRFYRDTDARAARQVEDTEPAEVLLAHLGCSQAQLAAEWQRFLERL